jgi:hypothetical protein
VTDGIGVEAGCILLVCVGERGVTIETESGGFKVGVVVTEKGAIDIGRVDICVEFGVYQEGGLCDKVEGVIVECVVGVAIGVEYKGLVGIGVFVGLSGAAVPIGRCDKGAEKVVGGEEGEVGMGGEVGLVVGDGWPAVTVVGRGGLVIMKGDEGALPLGEIGVVSDPAGVEKSLVEGMYPCGD